MRTARRSKLGALIVIFILIAVIAVSLYIVIRRISTPEEPDPHAGQVYLYDGFDWIWMTPIEGVPVNELTEDKFSSNNGTINYIGDDYDVLRGVDVSEHQSYIDWAQAASYGIDYAYIRAGWRGYTEGGIFADTRFEYNMKNASANGIRTGVYFFSQAISVQEAIEEAEFVLNMIDGYHVDMPIVFDWEKIEEGGARTDELNLSQRTDCAKAFCETVKNAGYKPCIYFNRNLGYYGYDLSRLTDYDFWFSLPESGFPNFYYACDMWQYSFTETVPGIEGGTDMNLWFIPKPVEALPTEQ